VPGSGDGDRALAAYASAIDILSQQPEESPLAATALLTRAVASTKGTTIPPCRMPARRSRQHHGRGRRTGRHPAIVVLRGRRAHDVDEYSQRSSRCRLEEVCRHQEVLGQSFEKQSDWTDCRRAPLAAFLFSRGVSRRGQPRWPNGRGEPTCCSAESSPNTSSLGKLPTKTEGKRKRQAGH
jgi:hypothetical protein